MSALPPVPLASLSPVFIRYDFSDTRYEFKLTVVDDLRWAQGIRFTCPTCQQDHGHHAHRIVVPFRGRDVPITVNGGHTWDVSGDGIADLTLMPSINAAGGICRWHGWITKGMVT